MRPVPKITADRFAFHFNGNLSIFCQKVVTTSFTHIIKFNVKTSGHEMCYSSHLELEW